MFTWSAVDLPSRRSSDEARRSSPGVCFTEGERTRGWVARYRRCTALLSQICFIMTDKARWFQAQRQRMGVSGGGLRDRTQWTSKALANHGLATTAARVCHWGHSVRRLPHQSNICEVSTQRLRKKDQRTNTPWSHMKEFGVPAARGCFRENGAQHGPWRCGSTSQL